MSSIKSHILGNRQDLMLERKGVSTPKDAQRAIDAATQPAKGVVQTAVPITSDIGSGAAVKDLMNVAHDKGLIDNQTTAGNAPITPLNSINDDSLIGIMVRLSTGEVVARKLIAHSNGIAIDTSDGQDGNIGLNVGGLFAYWQGAASIPGFAVNIVGPGAFVHFTNTDGNIVITNPFGNDGAGAAANPIINTATNPTFDHLVVNGSFGLAGSLGAPTRTAGTSAGNTATITATAGADFHGEFTLNVSGTGISTGQMVTITFQNARGNANYNVFFSLRSANCWTVQPYLSARSNSAFTMSFAVAPTSGQAYQISYLVVGR